MRSLAGDFRNGDRVRVLSGELAGEIGIVRYAHQQRDGVVVHMGCEVPASMRMYPNDSFRTRFVFLDPQLLEALNA